MRRSILIFLVFVLVRLLTFGVHYLGYRQGSHGVTNPSQV